MRILAALLLMIVFTTIGYAQNISPPIGFFMHGRHYDTFLRDHFQFKESNPLRIEYSYVNWLDSGENSGEYRDNLRIECLFPIYTGEKLIVDVPLQYSYMPVWGEAEGVEYGRKINIIEPCLTARWAITPEFKSIIGFEYNLEGDSEYFGKPKGRKICLLKGFLSYDIHSQLNVAIGARLDRYYYDIDEKSKAFEFRLDDRLYYQPAAMINWHPSRNFIILLGVPVMGVHFAYGDILKAEARLSVDKEMELVLKTEPVERISATLRFFNTPYSQIPVKERRFNEIMAERLSYTDKSIMLEMGRRLNPAAEASLAFIYSPGRDLELADEDYNNVITLDGKPHFDVAATFTLELDALTGKR